MLTQYIFIVNVFPLRRNIDQFPQMDDLRQGFLNGASAHLIKHYSKKFPDKKSISLETDMEDLQNVFWDETIDVVAKQIIRHATRARNIFAKMSFLKNTDMFEKLIKPLEQSARKAILERDRTKKFLEAYQE